MEYIVLDIESTGLDIEYSSIIEIGAVLVSGGRIKDEFSSFVKFCEELPFEIKKLTGIEEKDLINAPSVESVILNLQKFIGKRPVVCHNGFNFDFPMLERAGLKIYEKYDSLEFAFFVLPTHELGHSVSALARKFELGEPPHRALEDSRLEFEIICRLQKDFSKRKKEKAEALKALAKRMGWWWTELLPGKSTPKDLITTLVEKHEAYRKKNALQDQLLLGTQKIDFSEVATFFLPQNSSEGYSENRPEQQKMAAMITDSFNEHRHLVIEAGTGTGKSKAYLAPSVIFALKNSIPVIVATHTKALQDQLFLKEIPHLRETLPDLRVAVLKGKKNYVCLRKFEEFVEDVESGMQQRSLYEFGENGTRFTSRLAVLLIGSWILETNRGDWDELPYWLKEKIHKRVEVDVCNLDELCTKEICEYHEEEKCFLAKARLRAKDADLVIANHAIVLSGIIPSNQNESAITDFDEEPNEQLPPSHALFPNEAKFLVIDEAHHLEDDATSSWTYSFSKTDFENLIEQFYGKRGVKRQLASIVRDLNQQNLEQQLDSFNGMEGNIKLSIDSFFNNILPSLIGVSSYEGGSNYLSIRDLDQNPESKKIFFDGLDDLRERLNAISRIISLFADATDNEITKKILHVRSRSLKRLDYAIIKVLEENDIYVKYLERTKNFIEVKAAPLSVKQLLNEMVYNNFSSVILTSATLTVGKTFNFFADRCGTILIPEEKIKYSLLPSSFDYQEQVQLFVTREICYDSRNEESRAQHFQQCSDFLERAVLASGGGALILCSSHDQINRLYKKLHEPLAKRNILLLRQTKGFSVSSVIRDFKEDINSVLIGTETLWQGIDVPGDALRSLFIYKIPYRMPREPLLEARKREIEENGGNGFSEYYEPLAALTLKQGFGRLIRKITDKGIAVIMDERLLRRPMLLRSFPDGANPKGASNNEIIKALEDQNLIKFVAPQAN
jgi:predicted DnaQ family exonuclease/DinG family helicase